MTKGIETGSQAPSSEKVLTLQEVDQQAFDLIGKFMFVLRGTPAYLEALADIYQNHTAKIGDLEQQRYVKFSVGNRLYEVCYQFSDNRYSDMQSLDLIEKTANKQSLLLLSRRLQEQEAFSSARVLHFGINHSMNVNNPLAVEKAREMLKGLSSQK